MTILSLSDVSLSYGTAEILKKISFAINSGDRLGIVGRNGAGKTSLVRIIAGEEEPTSGSVYFPKDVTVGYLHQDASADADGDCTVCEYMYHAVPEIVSLEKEISLTEKALLDADPGEAVTLATRLSGLNERFDSLGGRHYRSRCDSLLVRTGFPGEDQKKKISVLSGGEKTRLALAARLFSDPDILILDEPTNHLDIDTLEWLEGYLAAYRKTLVCVSHDRYFLDRVTNKILYVENGRASIYPGNYSKAEELRDAERTFEEKRWKLQQKEIARIQAHIEQQRRFGRERNFVTIASREKALARMEKYDRPDAPGRSMKLSFETSGRSGDDVLSISGLTKSFGGTKLFSDVSLLVKRCERILLVGRNGTGKSTFIRILNGLIPPDSGEMNLGVGVRISYYDQENHGLDPSKTVFSEMSDAYPQKKDTEIRTVLGCFLFTGEDVFKQVSDLSGGEKCRLTLAKMICSPSNLLILDEPTNHLDIPSREALETALEDYGGTVIAVSHDRYFIDRIATRIVELLPGETGGTISYPLSADDDYGTFCEFRKRYSPGGQEKENSGTSSSQTEYLRKKEEAAAKRKAEKRSAFVASRIPELERLIKEAETELYADPPPDYTRAAELSRIIRDYEDELLALYDETM